LSVLKTTEGFVFAHKRLNLMSQFAASNGDFSGILLFAFIYVIKGYFAKKVSSDFSYTLTYLTLKMKEIEFSTLAVLCLIFPDKRS